MLKFNRKYFILTLIIFIVEVVIALFVHDHIIRPYVGDLLVVILIYCFIKSFFDFPVSILALLVLLFSYAVETLQYFKIVAVLGLEKSKLAKMIIGTSFAWQDIIAYTAGIAIVLWLEKQKSFNSKNATIK